jgi:hypothetical protein
MITRLTCRRQLFILAPLLLVIISSCKKDDFSATSANSIGIIRSTNSFVKGQVRLGIYEMDSSIYKLLYMGVTKIGTKSINYGLVFDTGSGGMEIDANGIVPPSMITSSGFDFTGDSTVVNGITITSEESIFIYGADNASRSTVYGNLAYASVTIGEEDGNIVIKRLPFFMYYKAVDAAGKQLPAHSFDILGVSPEYDIIFGNNEHITSPFSYFDPGNGLIKGFKMAALGTNNFSADGTYVPDAVIVGLTLSDLSSPGLIISPLSQTQLQGDLPFIQSTINYDNKSVSASVIFDTGTDPYNYIPDKTATASILLLQPGQPVSLATTSGFKYNYTTSATGNLTYIENPVTSGASFSIMGLSFFLNNDYLLDYTHHQMGFRNHVN